MYYNGTCRGTCSLAKTLSCNTTSDCGGNGACDTSGAFLKCVGVAGQSTYEATGVTSTSCSSVGQACMCIVVLSRVLSLTLSQGNITANTCGHTEGQCECVTAADCASPGFACISNECVEPAYLSPTPYSIPPSSSPTTTESLVLLYQEEPQLTTKHFTTPVWIWILVSLVRTHRSFLI